MSGGVRVVLAIAVLGCLAAARIETARAQIDVGAEVPDSVFTEKPAEPVIYTTTYDLNVSSGNWANLLSYNHSGRRATLGFDWNVNTLQAVNGLKSDGSDGSLGGRINLRATNRWIWSLDGTSLMFSNSDDLSNTERRQNRLQLRTQYSLNPLNPLSGALILSSEFQEEQSLGSRTIPGTSTFPSDTTVYRSHSRRDSSYTSGRRDGVSGNIRWAPTKTLDLKGNGAGTYLESKTRTLNRDFYALNPGEGAALSQDTLDVSKAPNGDRRFGTSAAFTGLPRTNMNTTLNYGDGDQEYYLLTKRDQEHVSYNTRGGTFHADHAPFPGGQIMVDGTVGRSLREYILQKNLNSLVNSKVIATSFMFNTPVARASLGLQVGQTRSDRQITQNGTVINRTLNASAAKKVTKRLWLDATGNITLFARTYTGRDTISNRDDVRGYLNAGGGYAVSPRCSTAVHFSTNRSHVVALDAGSSSQNNVQTTYQMDALLNLRVWRTFSILQNYSINANYLIYDYDEARNTLTRIRRIDTSLAESLFSFASMRLTHNFFFLDRGSYTRTTDEGSREYSVAQRQYQQNLAVTLGVRPFPGITLSATQSLANTRSYLPAGGQNTNRNRWNLNLGGAVDRDLPGDMTLHGSVQHVGEYTERPSYLPSAELVDYWLAGAMFTKSF